MINFEDKYFQKQKFANSQIGQFSASANRDLEIASKSDIAEVRFKFAFDALIKIGITLIARKGYKVRSQPGHHVKILEKLSEIIEEEDVAVFGNKMRQDRNKDFYEGGVIITDKETKEYLDFVKDVFTKARK